VSIHILQVGEFREKMPVWLKEKQFVVKETRFEGVEAWPLAFRALFEGGNVGKTMVMIPPAVTIDVPKHS
jgi:NADPH-dependent curcumin reductase CurA